MSALAPGTYDLIVGQYSFNVTAAPPTPVPSPDKTTIPPATQIVDNTLAIWTLVNGQVLMNGQAAGYSSNVVLVSWVSGKIWQQNASGGWWYWTGTTWVAGSNPTNPNPPTGDLTGKLTFFGGVFNLPSSSADHYQGNPYCETTQPSADLLYELVTTDPAVFKWGPVDNSITRAKATGNPFIWYCGYLNWAAGQGFPANYGYTGQKVVTMFDNLIAQAKGRYTEATLNQYCYFNYGNETLNAQAGTGNWEAAFGGKGSTGCDWVVNTGKIVRKYLPNAQIGINDYNVEDTGSMHQYGGGASRLPTLLSWLGALKNAGVLDWIGFEGYNLQSQTSAGLKSALDQCGAYAPVIYTEFSPGSYDWWPKGKGTVNDPPQADDGSSNTQVAAWKRLVNLFVSNPHCKGIVGPWVGSPAGDAFIFDGNPPVDRPAMTWLKSYIPSVLA